MMSMLTRLLMTGFRIRLVLNLLLLLFLPQALLAERVNVEKMRESVEAAKNAEGIRLKDYTLFDQHGREFLLSDYFKDRKPLVISYIYTSCPHVCPTITASFKKAVDRAAKEMPGGFNVLSIGFDAPNDTAEKLRKYGLRFVDDFKPFRFASADPDTMERLTGELGFFHKKKEDATFDHLDMVTVVKADGTIYRQVFAIRDEPDALLKRLRELVLGAVPEEKPSGLIDWIKYYCSRYDPYTDRYLTDWPVFVAFILQFMLISLIVALVWGKRLKGFFLKLAGKRD
ncbi:MAG: SCO family protein [Deltaproteobacteria bacterium]|nr:SCO family protein [Deltaproteobacteria bacterium]